MKTLREIQNIYAKKAGFKSFSGMIIDYATSSKVSKYIVERVINEAAIAYATMAIEEHKRLCAESSQISSTNYDNIKHIQYALYTANKTFVTADKNSILNAPNVELK